MCWQLVSCLAELYASLFKRRLLLVQKGNELTRSTNINILRLLVLIKIRLYIQ